MALERPQSRQPLPPHAKRVFKGVVFDVYQWEQELFDGTKTTFEKLKRPDFVGAVAVTKDKKIILTEQEQPGQAPFLGIVGGRVDEGETPEQAMRRELLEETGYRAASLGLLKAKQVFEKIDWVSFVFAAVGCEKVQEPKPDAGERFALRLVNFDEFVALTCSSEFRDPEITELITGTVPDAVRVTELKRTLGL